MKKFVACFVVGGLSEEAIKVAMKYGLEVRRIPVRDKPENWNLDGCYILVVHTEFLSGNIKEAQSYLEGLKTPLPKLRLLTSGIPRCPSAFYDHFVPAMMNIEMGGEKLFDEFCGSERATADYLKQLLDFLVEEGMLAPVKNV